MDESSKRVNSTPARFQTAPPGSGAASFATWTIGGAALVVVLTAGALFLGKGPEKADAQGPGASPGEPPASSPPLPAGGVLTPTDPLDITAFHLDAQERAKIWNPNAMLGSIEVVVESGRPRGAVEFVFGEPIGPSVPGAPLSPKRYRISYDGKRVDASAFDDPKSRTALPSPNCPLEAAFRQLTQSGGADAGPVAVLYVHSQSEGRPRWLMTTGSGKVFNFNADTCALLAR